MTTLRAHGWSLTAKLVFLLLIVACQNKQPEKIPADIIPPDSMTSILTDVHLVEGAKVGEKMMGNDSLKVRDYYKKIFSKYEVTQEQFDESFKYYNNHPAKMNDIYEAVIEELNKMEIGPPSESLHESEKKADSTNSKNKNQVSEPVK